MKTQIQRIIIISLILCGVCTNRLFSQPTYKPLSDKDLERVSKLLLQERMSGLLSGSYLSLGAIDLGPLEQTLSHNPIEGWRIKIGAGTNASFSRRFALKGFLAYGTFDRKFKYGLSAAVSLKRKPSSVYAFPANCLTLSYKDNTTIPSCPDYDAFYNSMTESSSYYLMYEQTANLTYLYEFPFALSVSPFVSCSRLYSSMYHHNSNIYETLSQPQNYIKTGAEVAFKPQRKRKNISSLNSMLYPLETYAGVMVFANIYPDYSDQNHTNASFLLQERLFIGRRMAVDFRLKGGKIFGNSDNHYWFSPLFSNTIIASVYGMNLLTADNTFFRKEYMQTTLQLNFCGTILNSIPFLKQLKVNEFIYGKALFGTCEPYYEVGAGIDNLFSCLGVELIRSFDMQQQGGGMWGVKIRLK